MRGLVGRRCAASLMVICASVIRVSTSPASATVATQASCNKTLVIGVPGSGEGTQPGSGKSSQHYGYGATVLQAIGSFKMAYRKSVTAEPLDYQAAAVTLDLLTPAGRVRYKNSVENGIATLTRRLNFAASQCPAQPIVLIGYSQGALVINQTLVRLGSGSPIQNQIAAVELIADPQRLGAASYTKGTASRSLSGISVAAGFYPVADLPQVIQDRTDSYCQSGDLVCATDP